VGLFASVTTGNIALRLAKSNPPKTTLTGVGIVSFLGFLGEGGPSLKHHLR